MSTTTDPKDPRLTRGADDGPVPQNEVYLVLPEEDRARGFVRPLRHTYVHVGPAASTNPLRPLTDDEHERYDQYGYVAYEAYPNAHEESSVLGRFWTQAQLDSVGKGCGTSTTMADSIAETYARDPHFYGSTYCCGCSRHIAVAEFVWQGTNERVGS